MRTLDLEDFFVSSFVLPNCIVNTLGHWITLLECGADLWSEHGLITSPNYPYTYHSYRTCIWRITVPDNHYVIITFHEFDINKSYRPCFVDSVEIRDGYTEDSPLLGRVNN